MEKTIKIGNVPVKLNNNIGWAMAYRDQFGQDIIPVIMPLLAGIIDIATGMIKTDEKGENIGVMETLRSLDGDTLIEAASHLSALEFVDFINIIWALAKSADEDIPEPREWVKQFDTFPVDTIAPAVLELVSKGLLSSKNLKRLNEFKRKVQPAKKSTQTPSSSQDLSEG